MGMGLLAAATAATATFNAFQCVPKGVICNPELRICHNNHRGHLQNKSLASQGTPRNLFVKALLSAQQPTGPTPKPVLVAGLGGMHSNQQVQNRNQNQNQNQNQGTPPNLTVNAQQPTAPTRMAGMLSVVQKAVRYMVYGAFVGSIVTMLGASVASPKLRVFWTEPRPCRRCCCPHSRCQEQTQDKPDNIPIKMEWEEKLFWYSLRAFQILAVLSMLVTPHAPEEEK